MIPTLRRIAWITDPHLNFAAAERIGRLIAELNESDVDALLVGGDIGEADSFDRYLCQLADGFARPIYFVLGNHDYYRGSIARVRETARRLTRESSLIRWLPEAGFIQLSKSTGLVGHGGWGDGRIGDFLNSTAVLNDYFLIDELRNLHTAEIPSVENILTPNLLAHLQSLGQDAADSLATPLEAALDHCREIIVLTHVPPFLEACWHNDTISDENWSPHFTCAAVGDLLRKTMLRHPDRSMLVLCGHTHGAGRRMC
jgi:predicted phosphohydrolase